MAHYPDFETFSKLASTADYVPVYRRVLSDVLTPVSAFHKIDDGSCACLFESVIGGEKVGRYSFLAADPFKVIEARGNQVSVSEVVDHHLDRERVLTAPKFDHQTNPLTLL